jgi:L-threonylcarbamoyladenylate synthase
LPIISTSANIAGDDPIIKFEKIDNYFGNKIDYIVQGEIGGSKKPSRIIDLLTKKVLREGG